MSQCPPVMLRAGPLTSILGPGYVAGVDGVAQSDVTETTGAYVANRRESRQQRGPRILGADERLSRHRDCQPVVAEPGLHRQVRVRVNQARQHGCVGQIDAHCIRGNFRLRRRHPC